MKNKLLFPFLLISTLSGCTFNINTQPSKDIIDPTVNPTKEETPVVVDDKTPDKNHLDDEISSSFPTGNTLFNEFFKYGNKISIELSFTNLALSKLEEYGHKFGNNENYPKNEIYHPCTMKISINGNTATYYEVGARMRGNTSREDAYGFVDSSGHFDRSKNFHFKLNFGQTFSDSRDNDYYVKPWTNETKKLARDDRKFGKMKKIDFKWNRNYDNTFTKELYALDAFRNEGVLAQHANLVEVTIKSENDSITHIYQALESIDKQLIKKALPNDYSGDLYKCLYQNTPADLTNTKNLGIEQQGFRPTYDLKTNEDTSNMSVFKTFVTNINKRAQDGFDGELYYENISKYMDVDNFLKYSALCWVMGLPDDLRNNANNYYLYFNNENKAYFIPYDNDRCLGIRNGWDKDLKDVRWDETYGIGYSDFNKCPLILRLVSGGSNNTHKVHEASKEKFHQYCISYANKYLDVNSFDTFTKQFKDIATSVDISNGGPSNDSFSVYATSKKATLN